MKLFVTPHALQRLRDHWADVRCMPKEKLIRALRQRLSDALDRNKQVKTPGGTYVPFSLGGQDGFAVMHGTQIVTVQPAEWCEEIMEQGDFF